MNTVMFFVPGIPRPQGSKRYLGPGKVVESGSKHVAPWRADVRAAAETAIGGDPGALWDQPVVALLRFFFPRPKSHYGTGRNADVVKDSAPQFPATPPDLDKLARAVLDALTGAVIADDKTVVTLIASKDYLDESETRPGVWVTVETVDWYR